jgi:hypothetical protein
MIKLSNIALIMCILKKRDKIKLKMFSLVKMRINSRIA